MMQADRSGQIDRRLFALLTLLLAGGALLYAIAAVVGNAAAANLLSPFVELTGAACLMASGIRLRPFRAVWMLLGIGLAIYGLSDIGWAYVELRMGLNPDDLLLFSFLYLLPNLCFALGILVYFRRFTRGWNLTQLLLDVSAVSIVLLDTFWMMFFREWTLPLLVEDMFILIAFVTLLLDLICLGLAFSLSLTARMRRLASPVLISLAGLALYIASDVHYFFQEYHGLYVSNNLADILYVAALALIGIGGLHRLRRGSDVPAGPEAVPLNIRWRPKILLLLLGPLLLLLTGMLRLEDLLLVLAVLLVHGLVSAFLQIAVRSRALLAREQEITEQLEIRVAEKTADLIRMNRELELIAHNDPVTGMSNRRHFLNLLDQTVGSAGGEAGGEASLVLFYMDLDRFKGINDAYGQDTGDRVLCELAARIEALARPGMLTARIGGDEFAVAVPGLAGEDDIRSMAERLVNAIQEPIDVSPWRFLVSVSLGIARCPEDAETRPELMTMAEMAMYHAKKQDAQRFSFYSNWFREGMRRRHEIEMALRRADFEQEFTLHYQPQFLSRKRSLVGMEALLRWQSPALGAVSPAEFIPVAEDTGLIIQIGQWVCRHALLQIADWNRRYATSLRMGINFSPRQFDVAGFIESFNDKMRRYGVHPSWVDVEITENTAMRTEVSTEEMLTALTALGVSISIDDFGTGYSSLSYIKRFDIDCLKIAKPLIDNVARDEGDELIIGAIVQMAKIMRLRTIAEGVEDEGQLAILQRLGCDEIQGFLMGKPVPADRFESLWLRPADMP